jgi:D-3-phosphoglycerate dehydrogenase
VSNKKNILIIQPIHEEGIKLLENNPNYNYEVIEYIKLEDIKNKIQNCDGLSIRTAKLPGEIIDLGKKLKVISRHGVGYDNVDLAAIKKNKITLTITATANAVAVAEHVMFMLLNICKRKSMYDDAVKNGNLMIEINYQKQLSCGVKIF